MAQRDFAGRVALITGAGKGLGRAYALELARRGACVVVNNRRHPGESDAETSAGRVVAEIAAAGGRAVAEYSSVEAPHAGTTMVETALAAYGRLDILIANAAAPQAKSFHKTSLADFRAIFDVAFLGTLHVVHAAWPVLRAQGYGRVLLTTSSAGRFGQHGLAAYGAAKGAIDSLVRTLAAEGAEKGIKVNGISPYALTQMTADYMRPDVAALFAPEKVAEVVAWLTSESCTMSGETIVAGGGRIRSCTGVETASIAFDPSAEDPGAPLAQVAARGYRDSNQAFDSLLVECGLAPRKPVD